VFIPIHPPLRILLTGGLLTVASLVTNPASAGVIPFGQFLEFSFSDAGVGARGCNPADPAAAFCQASSGTSTAFLDAPAWTFNAPAAGAALTVTDAFESGDRFEILDFGVFVGMTSLPAAAGAIDCGDDPVPCRATAGISSGVFALGAGNHSITIVPLLSQGLGAAYLRVDVVPEPAVVGLMLAGLALVLRRRTRAHRIG
jgi:hypothetical protein